MDLVLCKMCKEPIWNFLCIDCLADDIKGVLPSHLTQSFRKFHHDLKRYFYNRNHGTYCIRCGKPNPVAICPYCYLNEAGNWMMGMDQILAKRLLRLIPPFRHKHDFPNQMISMKFTEAIEGLENGKEHSGLCDRCGEFSEGMRETEGGWLCESCRE